jgi:hypothetical protein
MVDMALRRSILAAAASCAVALGVGVSPAGAARPLGYAQQITTAHFAIHYTNLPGSPDLTTDQAAADLGALAETAYTDEVQTDGFPAPLSDVAVDGDPHIDIWIANPGTGSGEAAVLDNPGAAQSSGYILLDPATGLTLGAVARELFRLIQAGIWADPNTNQWFENGAAEWMGFRVQGYPGDAVSTIGPPEISLDCFGPTCANTAFDQDGSARWTFFQYLGEHFGATVVKDVLAQQASPMTTGLSTVLGARGTNLADTFTGWATATMTGGFQPAALQGLPPATYASISTGTSTGSLPPLTLAVNHLAARYLAFTRGDGLPDHPCYAATLTVTVTLPAGVGAKPAFYWSAPGSAATPLAISGNQATATVPWDTCAWAHSGYLMLPNPSTSTDGALYTVNASVTVDPSTPASSAAPPPQIPVWGPVLPAPTNDAAPSLNLYAPELIRVSARTRLLRFIVFSSGDGQLRATLGTSSLGMSTLRAGTNDIRFVLPKSLVTRLRSTSGSQLLQLTSFSPSGTSGATVTRRVTVVRPKPKKPRRH